MGEPHTIESFADCGCRVEIANDFLSGEDEIHVYPCSPAHEPALAAAARDLAQRAGIEYEEK